ncbi:hypothetical protein Vafri_12122 [Volvox africanus]|uniref:Protein kinase domain-containing protein n=1 Tax=Volvox africanus TaxID=51714 RepID=A0A8J4F2D1_9CHLO|nr:hypothetical protein Vafri_12122 [Volvox africanus]
MWSLRCCFTGEARDATALEGSVTGNRDNRCTHVDSNLTPTVKFAARNCQEIAEGFPETGNHGALIADCVALNTNATVAIDATTPIESLYLPALFSDLSSRPELEVLLPSPFRSANRGSFSKLFQLPDSPNLDNLPSTGGHSARILGAASWNAPSRQSPAPGLPNTTITQLIGSVSSATWVGQGAQGAVVKAQWRTGCTVAVKWLVTDAVNVPAAFMEAIVAKMLAHPFLVQTFDCSMCQLDEIFDGMIVHHSYDRTSSARPKSATCLHVPEGITHTNTELSDGEQFSVVTAIDSFEDTQTRHLGGRAVDCLDVLKQLGAAPGKYVMQIVCEWCDEGTLLSAIRGGVFRTQSRGPGMPGRSRTWALRALLRTAREIAQGMCHLHSLGIIHGDLKPGNVLLKSSRVDTRGFVAKVADFGLSRMCSQREEFVATSDWGTVPYMAGEYLDNRLYKSSDVYSFGVLLWQMYTGKAPFVGHLDAQVAVGVMMGNLQLEWPTNMPSPLLRLGQACCRHEPDQRPPFTEVVAALVAIEAHVRELAIRSKARQNVPASGPLPVLQCQKPQPQLHPLSHTQQAHHHQQLCDGFGIGISIGSAQQHQPNQQQQKFHAPPAAAGGGVGCSVIAGLGVEAANAVAAEVGMSMPYSLQPRLSSLEPVGGEVGVAAVEMSCLLSRCGLKTEGNAACGDGDGDGGGGCIASGSSLSYQASDSMPISYLPQQQLQHNNGQPSHNQQQKHYFSSPLREASAAPHAFHVAALARLPDGTCTARALPPEADGATAAQSEPLGDVAAFRAPPQDTLRQRPVRQAGTESASAPALSERRWVMAASAIDLGMTVGELWHRKSLESGAHAGSSGGCAATQRPAAAAGDTNGTTVLAAASPTATTGGANTMTSTMMSSCSATATTPKRMYWSDGSASFTQASFILGTMNGCPGATGSPQAPQYERSAAMDASAGMSASTSVNSWAPVQAIRCLESPQPVLSTRRNREGDGQKPACLRLLRDLYGQYTPSYPYAGGLASAPPGLNSSHIFAGGGPNVPGSAAVAHANVPQLPPGQGLTAGGGAGGSSAFISPPVTVTAAAARASPFLPFATGKAAVEAGTCGGLGSSSGGGSSGSPGLRPSYIRSASGLFMPLIMAVAPISKRAMSSRRGSAGPALEHVPEDDDLDGVPVAASKSKITDRDDSKAIPIVTHTTYVSRSDSGCGFRSGFRNFEKQESQ